MKALKLCQRVSKMLIGEVLEIKVDDLFSYLKDDECILIPKKIDFSDEMERTFVDMCNDIGLGALNPYLASFIHELGHHATLPFVDDDEFNKYQAQVQLLETLMQTDLLSVKDTNEFYHLLEVENLANEWALDAFQIHKEKLLEVNKQFNKIYKWR